LSAVTNSRRVAVGAEAALGRQTRTMLEARALVPEPIVRLPSSVRIGQVPLMAKLASMTAARKVSPPVFVVPSAPSLSDCLKA
jgi:hypothetical protein